MTRETIVIEMPCDQAVEVYCFCSEHRLTLDELVEQFMRWCIREPEACKQWIEANRHILEQEDMNQIVHHSLSMPTISEEELVAHIEDDDFLLVYGNPLLIRSKDKRHDCVIMSIQYYERTQRLLGKIEDQIESMIDRNVKQHPSTEQPTNHQE